MENIDIVELGELDLLNHTLKVLRDREKNAESHGNQLLPSIFMVPSVFRNLSPTSFNPRVVSIGPLHREEENLIAYEGQKMAYMASLLSRVKDAPKEETLKACFDKVTASIEKIKACYSEMKPNAVNKLAYIMVIDSCFILEFVFKIFKFDESVRRNILLTQYIMYDLFLVENQIPFFVLQDVFECTILKFQPTTLTELIVSVIKLVTPFEERERLHHDVGKDTTPYHILDFLHKLFQPMQHAPNRMSSFKTHSALELDRAGVSFKPNLNPNPKRLLEIEVELSKFPCISWCWGKPTLKMPVVQIDDFTELVFRNLIAYEQCFDVSPYITSYAVALDIFFDTTEDVALLIESKVLVNGLGSNEEAVNMINRLCKEIAITSSYYDEQMEQLDKYYKGYWPKNMARLRRTYFNSPWNFMALVAAIILFALTVVQTFFSITAA